jgi:hypothetical protein
MKLEDVAPGQSLSGIEPTDVVAVVGVVPLAESSVQLIYRTPEGAVKERLLGRADEASFSNAIAERPFSFDGNGVVIQLACEGKRIDFAFLFDPMMVHSSNLEALPHPDHRRLRVPVAETALAVRPRCSGLRAKGRNQ